MGLTRATSKFLSYVLRHHPESVGLTLSPEGWVPVEALLVALAQSGNALDRAQLERLVSESDKQRFALSADGSLIRASQGHSVPVRLGYESAVPPDVLYHGTVERFLPAIRGRGLLRGQRHHVHLSAAREVAAVVGARRGKPVVLEVDAAAMVGERLTFCRSANGGAGGGHSGVARAHLNDYYEPGSSGQNAVSFSPHLCSASQ